MVSEGVGAGKVGSQGGFRSLVRRKKVDSHRDSAEGHHQLAKALSISQLIAIGKLRLIILIIIIFIIFMIFIFIIVSSDSSSLSSYHLYHIY